jgi:hypothetical protein
VGAVYRNESLIGAVFEGKVEAAVGVGEFEGILPSVGGWAEIIGHNTIFVDDEDPLAHGFQLVSPKRVDYCSTLGYLPIIFAAPYEILLLGTTPSPWLIAGMG